MNWKSRRKSPSIVLEILGTVKSFPNRVSRSRPKKKFVIFGRGRSGSTLLVNTLNLHPDIECLGEVMHHKKAFPINYLNNVLAKARSDFFGFKILTYQVRGCYDTAAQMAIHKWLVERNFIVFYICRENLFSWAVSNIYARRRGAFHSTDKNSTLDMKVTIDPEEILIWMEGGRASLQFESRFLEGLEFVPISYEHDLATRDALSVTYHKILDVLGANQYPLMVTNEKVTPSNYSDFIMNYNEIVDRIGSTEFCSYLPHDASARRA